ncbi:MAG: hypothetical protein IT447_14740 [Phycisphaerales bacterium]|jgi:hypothetical protein|nr:hypothetical protein [Phycisphaerales bacterium]
MKSFIILVLLAALAGAMTYTKPTEADFKSYVMQRVIQGSENKLEQFTAAIQVKGFLDTCKYKNYFLWSTVSKDDKTIYVGALSHWFAREDFPGRWEITKSQGS